MSRLSSATTSGALSQMFHILVLSSLCLSFVFGSADAAKAGDFVDPMKHDVVLVTAKTFDNLISRHRNADGVAVLLHFSSQEKSMKDFVNDVFNEAAKELKGMVRLGAIDCAEWTVFCKENLNPELKYPMVVVYPPNPMPPTVLEANDKKSISSNSLRFIPGNHVQTITSSNIDSFLTAHVAVPKVLLFSTKEKAPVLFKALSNAFSDRVSFGLVAPSEASLAKRYNVKKTPTLLLLKAAQKGTGMAKPEVFSGKMKYDALHEWVNVRAETFVKGGGFSDASAPDMESMPKPWLVQKVPEVTGPSHQDVCFKGSSLCVIFLNKGTLTDEQSSLLEDLSSKFPDTSDRGARFKFMWMDIAAEPSFQQLLKIDPEARSLPTVAVVNPHKRLRFLTLPADLEATASNIESLLEGVVAGNGRFTIVPGNKVPSFAVREAAAAPNKKEEL